MSKLTFLRYPGGKQKMLEFLRPNFPDRDSIKGRYIEPFLGGGALFFDINPYISILSDINPQIIDLFLAIKNSPTEVWKIYESFPSGAKSYYQIRDMPLFYPQDNISLAARFLYLNRTSFNGIYRQNRKGEYNIAYGGEKRRSAIEEATLLEVSNRLQNSTILVSDFEKVIGQTGRGDFIFADPPYQPGEIELKWNMYMYSKFGISEHLRLSQSLKKAHQRGVSWALTTTSHQNIINLFTDFNIIPLSIGTGKSLGHRTENSGEILVKNY